ncbi:MAG: hypothetical protein M1531_06675 [Chloroflexi bacterium]|nr:hypothetical protein [Chloroflexota bacterium]
MRVLYRAAIITSLALMLSLLIAPAASAAELRTGPSVSVGRNEVVNDDVYAFGTSVVIDGRIEGDLVAAGQSILINGEVTGSVWAAGQSLTINGTVGGSARLAGQFASVSGNVKGDLLFAGQALSMAQGATIGRDVWAAGATGDILGSVGRNMRVSISELTIGGPVKGDVDARVESLTLGPGANIGGNLTYTSANEASVGSGARVAGQTVRHPVAPRAERPAESVGGRIVGWLIGLLMAFVVGLVVVLLVPLWSRETAGMILRHPWASLGWGAVALFAVPPALIIIAITIVGIPLALIILVLYLIALYLSQIIVGLFIGRWVLDFFAVGPGRLTLLGALAIGLVILSIAREVPFLGAAVTLAFLLWGLGALVLAFYEGWAGRQAAQISAAGG